ncbi:unnamed protein product [Didymodactylos carnosus]|uniref:Uncharacterized protein n=1 Tax=Didymodactylos carnosus TaxID=1234261 RepID=A0A8S2XFZ9_9BILA|nr:unnamed protein product [Didymodactylos carnosus]
MEVKKTTTTVYVYLKLLTYRDRRDRDLDALRYYRRLLAADRRLLAADRLAALDLYRRRRYYDRLALLDDLLDDDRGADGL